MQEGRVATDKHECLDSLGITVCRGYGKIFSSITDEQLKKDSE